MKRARLTIDLEALAANYGTFREAAAGASGAVVKSDAYGLGARRVVERLIAAGCRHFFVETPEEAVRLREFDTVERYVLGGANDSLEVDELKSVGAFPVANCPDQLRLLTKFPAHEYAVHVDTGMHRLGFTPDEFRACEPSRIQARLLLTHLACADTPDHPLNRCQTSLFEELTSRVQGTPTSIGNSAGTLLGVPFQGDLVRPGIGLYGGNPFLGRTNPLRNVCTLEARVLRVRDVPANKTVGYGAAARTERPSRVAVVGIGYADGIPVRFSQSGSVSCRGTSIPLLGVASMDMMQVDATSIPDLKRGEWVEFFGPSQSLDEVARAAGKSSYELLTGLSARLHRDYV
ncbi:MAG: alanine racemase [Pseudomonadales bacterium]|nr:alanine racemase [Pseudomonadales bacterium]